MSLELFWLDDFYAGCIVRLIKGVIFVMLFLSFCSSAAYAKKQPRLSVRASLIIIALLAWVTNPAVATAIYSEDFTGFNGSGFTANPSAGQLDSDFFRVTGLSDGNGVFGGGHTANDFARGGSGGGVSTGGIYAFDISNGAAVSDTALGIQQTGTDLTSGDISLRLVNQSSSIINLLEIQFDIYELNNKGRSSSVNFEYSVGDESSYNPLLFFISHGAESNSASWLKSAQSVSLASLNWAPTEALFLRWSFDDAGGSGSRDELAIDNIYVTEMVAIPEPDAFYLFILGLLVLGFRGTCFQDLFDQSIR